MNFFEFFSFDACDQITHCSVLEGELHFAKINQVMEQTSWFVFHCVDCFHSLNICGSMGLIQFNPFNVQ
jgi:hypothetical protein